jgi:competence protein ComEA
MRRARPEHAMLALTLAFVLFALGHFALSRPAGGNAAVVAAERGGVCEAPEKLDVNAATEEELCALPGIGAVKAAAIVNYRETHGPFESMEALDDVPGIGAATIEHLIWYAEVKN